MYYYFNDTCGKRPFRFSYCCRLIINIGLLVTVMTGIKLLQNQTQGKDFKYYIVYVRKNGPATCVF